MVFLESFSGFSVVVMFSYDRSNIYIKKFVIQSITMSMTGEDVSQETGSDVEAYFWIDNCDTAYTSREMDGHGDVGRNIADHPESELVGFENPKHFDQLMHQIAQRDDVSHSSQLVWHLANQDEIDDIDELRSLAVDAQHPNDYGDGFKHFNEFLYGEPAERDIVTAAWEDPVDYVVNDVLGDYAPGVIGGRLKQNGAGIEVEKFCGGREKAERIQQERGIDVNEAPSFAFGNSSGDRPMMMPADEAFGRDRAEEFSTLYTPEDEEFWTMGTLGVGAYELASGGEVYDAVQGMEEFLETGEENYDSVDLDPVTRGGRETGEYTEYLSNAYETVKESF